MSNFHSRLILKITRCKGSKNPFALVGGLNIPHLTHDNIRFPIYLMIHILIDSGLSDGVEITFWAIGLENFGMEGSGFDFGGPPSPN